MPGHIIRIRIGDFVPADVKIIQREVNLDQSAITGESLELQKKAKEIIYSGSIVTKGEATGLATLTGANGLIMALEVFGLLYIGLKYFNLSTDNKALNTFCFEILLFLALFSIFVVRKKNHFWHSTPSKTLLFLIIGDMILGILFSTFGLLGFKTIPLRQTLVVYIFTAVFSFIINDLIKFILFKKWPIEPLEKV